MDEHDTSYKLLFSHDRMVRDLLIGFLPAEWVVLPIVLYNGERRWRAPTRLRPLIHVPPAGLESFQPDQSFLLIDEGAYESGSAPLDNLVAALFRLEHHRSPGEVATVLERLVKWLSDPEQAPLRRDYLIWLRRRLPRWFPGEVFPEFQDLQEVYDMIDNRFAEWKEQQRQEGVLQGVAQGREQGLEQGLEQGRAVEARRLLGRLLARRFGPVSGELQARLDVADTGQLELWIERLLDVNTLDDVFR